MRACPSNDSGRSIKVHAQYSSNFPKPPLMLFLVMPNGKAQSVGLDQGQ